MQTDRDIRRITIMVPTLAIVFLCGMGLDSKCEENRSAKTPDFTRLRAQIQEVVTEKVAPGASVLVAQNGNVIFKEARGSLSVDSTRMIASITKSAVASAVMILVDQQRISLEDSISKYLTEFSGTPVKNATIRQLLCHSSGVFGGIILPPPVMSQPTEQIIKSISYTRPSSHAELARDVAQYGRLSTPGEFKYTDTNYDLLCAIVEKIYPTFEKYIYMNLFEPLGMMSKFSVPQQNMCIHCGGGLLASLDDLYALFQMHLSGGTYRGIRVISLKSVHEMHKKQAEGKIRPSDQNTIEYGLGFFRDRILPNGSPRTIYHSGFFGTLAWADFDSEIVGVLFFDADWQRVKSVAETIQDLIREVVLSANQ